MKKILIKAISVLLAICLLTGCGSGKLSFDGLGDLFSEGLSFDGLADLFNGGDDSRTAGGGMVKFSEMPYSRPDMDAFRADVDAVIGAVKEPDAKLRGVIELLDRVDADYGDFYTMYGLANIRNSIDLTDGYYAEEYAWIDGTSSEVSQMIEKMYYACAASGLGPKLEREYFWDGFCEEYADESESMYTDEMVELMKRESGLLSEYRDLCSEPEIVVNGQTVDYNEYLESVSGYSDYAGYMNYIRTLYLYYDQYVDRFADIYIDLIRVRSEIARQAGYEDYRQYQYEYFFDRDYTPEQAQVYIDDIARYIAPVRAWCDEEYFAGETGSFYLGEDTLREDMKQLTDGFGGYLSEAYSFMTEWELCDIGKSDKKMSSSFETYLYNYDAPFVFMDAQNDSGDLLTCIHEFGHFTDDFVNYGSNASIDVAEVFSQSLEMLSLGYMDGFMTESSVENITAIKMLDIVSMYTQQASFAEFENRVYAEDPDKLTAASISRIMREVEQEFGWYEAEFDPYYSQFWIDITHFFEYPFYVISYPVSNDIPMQIYGLMQREGREAALDKYVELLDADHTSLSALAGDAKLENPFAEGRVEDVANVVKSFLQEHFT